MTEHSPNSSDGTPSIAINIANTATATANASGGAALSHPSLFMRILWFCVIGWYAGAIWLGVMALFAITIIGFPFAVAQGRYLTTALWLGKVNW